MRDPGLSRCGLRHRRLQRGARLRPQWLHSCRMPPLHDRRATKAETATGQRGVHLFGGNDRHLGDNSCRRGVSHCRIEQQRFDCGLERNREFSAAGRLIRRGFALFCGCFVDILRTWRRRRRTDCKGVGHVGWYRVAFLTAKLQGMCHTEYRR